MQFIHQLEFGLRKAMRHRADWHRLLYLVIVATIAVYAASYLQIAEGYWVLIAALFGFGLSTHFIFYRAFLVFIGIGVISALGVLIASLLAKHVFLLALFLLLTTWLTIYAGLLYASVWGLGFAANVSIMLAASVPVSMMDAIQRFWCVLLGFLIAFIIRFVFIRDRSQAVMRMKLAYSLYRLAQLGRVIFSAYITHNYADEHFSHEKNLHLKRCRYLYEIDQARQLLTTFTGKRREQFSELINLIECSYEMLQSISLLIYRVDDHSTFAVADKELITISSSMVKEFDLLAEQLQQRRVVAAQRSTILNENIYEMEEIHCSVLQVVASEPLVFMIFIQDMYGLDKIMTQLFGAILRLVSR